MLVVSTVLIGERGEVGVRRCMFGKESLRKKTAQTPKEKSARNAGTGKGAEKGDIQVHALSYVSR